MARLEIVNARSERKVIVTLSRRNLLALLQKLDMPGSAREIVNNDCYEDGAQTPFHPAEEALSDLPRTPCHSLGGRCRALRLPPGSARADASGDRRIHPRQRWLEPASR